MKYFQKLIYVFLLCWILPAYAENDGGITREQARSIVQNFYSALKSLPNVSNDNFYEYRDKHVYPYIISDQAFHHPDDIHPLVFKLNGSQGSKQINAYMGDIRNYNRDHNLRIDYKICEINDLREVVYEDQKERLALTYWEITVDKSFSINGQKYVLNDTVDVKISNGRIAFISNRMYREASPRPKGSDGKEIEAWHNELIARAARYWNQSRKKEAFDTYIKSVENYDDPDTYFRIGLLLLKHHKECTNLNKKEARNLAYTYFWKARKLGHSEAYRVTKYYWDDDYNGPVL